MPDRRGAELRRDAQTSFSEDDVRLLHFILLKLTQGTSPATATRHKDFANLQRKVLMMKKTLARRAAQRRAAGLQAGDGPRTCGDGHAKGPD